MALLQVVTMALAVIGATLALTTDPCDKACPKTLIWVCGSDNVSYTNMCAVEVASCKNKSITFAHDGMCVKDRSFDTSSSCPKCKEGGDPVCGMDGLTYVNECALTAIACSQADNSLKVKHGGECTSDETMQCPPSQCTGGSPVCATNGISTLSRSFDSACDLHSYMCATGRGLMPTSDPSCLIPNEPPAPEAKCDIVCHGAYEPVCGSDGQTYSNACMLKLSACQADDSALFVAREGECSSEAEEHGGSFWAIFGGVLGLSVLLAIAAVVAIVLRGRALRRRRFRMMESYEDDMDESDSERSLDVQDMHMKASQIALDSSFGELPRKESL